MSERDVSGDGMTNHELTDTQLQALLEGTTGSSLDDHPVASFLGDTRAAFSAVEAPSPNAALAEFVGVGQADSTINAADIPPVVDAPLHDVTLLDPVGAPRRRTNMIPALTAFIGTTIGKIAVGGSVAFAATAGAHATGVVDVPGLPDPEVSIVDSIDDNSDDGQSASTDSTPSTTTGVAAADDSSNDSSNAPTVASTTSSTTTSPTSSSSTPSTSIAAAGQGALVSIAVLDAGVVDVRFDPTEPTLVRSFALDGWQSRIDDADELGEIDLIFTNGTQRVDFSLEYDDGFARARIRDRATESESFMWYSLEDGSLVRGPVGDDDSDSDDESDSDDDQDDSDDSDDSEDDVDDGQDDIDDDDTDSDDEDEDESDSDDSDDIDDDDSDDSDDSDDD